jgi:putative membrane-bound dehydrogenase-like protein
MYGLKFVVLVALTATWSALAADLEVRSDVDTGKIEVFRSGGDEPILTQNARADFRPYIHPIVAPDGRGVLTEFSPDYNPHQTGLYWGFTQVNGRDFFHHPGDDYWRRVSAIVLKPASTEGDPSVQWRTVYDQLDADGNVIMQETQLWTMSDDGDAYTLDLEWSGQAQTDVTIGEFDYGGMFLRMPWNEESNAQIENSVRQINQAGEGQRAVWLDMGIQVEGRDDMAHIAIFDHPDNEGYPQPWRVDSAFGVGPVRARLGDWSIGSGETATAKHRLRVYTGELNDVTVTDAWGAYTGNRRGIPSVQWDLYRQEGYAAEFLTPQEAVEAMTLPEDFVVNVFASEPMITQPMAFCWDDRGRLWIAENRDFKSRGGGVQITKESRILILEDVDGDGVADTKKVFMEDIVFPCGMAIGHGGLWLGAIPNLLFVPDRDGDDKADLEDIEVRLTGWGQRDLHETLNSFHWGPDGWLYGLQGVFTPSVVGKPAGEHAVFKPFAPYPKKFEYADEPTKINGGVWRYHPTKDIFEVVAHGFSNPWGIDFDAKGQIFISACVIPHLWHVVQGGLYHRQAGSHFNRNAYQDIRTIGDHRHRSAHGGARVYLSDAFPEEYHGQLFMGNIHEHAVLIDELERQGSGFVGRHGENFLMANNAQFIGFSTEIGPGGGVYMLDWHDGDICGNAVLTEDTGRVFRIMPKESNAEDFPNRYADLSTLSDADLVELQLSASAWHARRARVILQYRSVQGNLDSKTRPALERMFSENDNADHRLRAMWALHVTGGIAAEDLIKNLGDDDEYIRAWTIQLICEDKDPSKAARAQFAAMAKGDDSPAVRLYLASALQRMDIDHRWPIVTELAKHTEDANDHNIPKILWYGMEPLVAQMPKESLELVGDAQIPMITQHVARRLTAAGELEELVAMIGANPDARELLLLGMRDGLEGQSNIDAPNNWAGVYAELRSGNDESASIALQLSLQFGDKIAAQALVNMIGDSETEIEDRREAIRGLAARKRPELKPQLIALLKDENMRSDAIRAMASYDDESLAKALLEQYPNMTSQDKLEVLHTMAARSDYGALLTESIKNGDVPRRDIPAYIARLLFRVVGNRFLMVWGPVETLPEYVEEGFTKFRGLLTAEALEDADPRKGRAIFRDTCFACHKMYGEGGLIGPDLTGANRSDIEYLLTNILTPNADIQDDYKMNIVLTKDGQMYSGVAVGENRRRLQLRVTNVVDPIVIPKSEIEDREIAELSMMPEGLLDYLSDQEALDLFAYLRNLEQVPLQAAAKP